MEELARDLNKKITDICAGYLFFKQTDVIEKVRPLTEDIQRFLNGFIQGDMAGMGEGERTAILGYAAGVAQDYVEAMEQKDMVLMVDTLDYGLRELLQIYAPSMEEG